MTFIFFLDTLYRLCEESSVNVSKCDVFSGTRHYAMYLEMWWVNWNKCTTGKTKERDKLRHWKKSCHFMVSGVVFILEERKYLCEHGLKDSLWAVPGQHVQSKTEVFISPVHNFGVLFGVLPVGVSLASKALKSRNKPRRDIIVGLEAGVIQVLDSFKCLVSLNGTVKLEHDWGGFGH